MAEFFSTDSFKGKVGNIFEYLALLSMKITTIFNAVELVAIDK